MKRMVNQVNFMISITASPISLKSIRDLNNVAILFPFQTYAKNNREFSFSLISFVGFPNINDN